MWVAVTGTPGTGKTTLARELERRGYRVVRANDLARDAGLLHERDPGRHGTFVVDVDALAETFVRLPRPEAVEFVEGHFAHDLPVDLVVLLRHEPIALSERLRARGWPEAKVRENVEAEALDVIAGEVESSGLPAAEVDATGRSVESLADEVLAIVESGAQGLKSRTVGSVAWPLESIPWFGSPSDGLRQV